jgi:hypothetical protein
VVGALVSHPVDAHDVSLHRESFFASAAVQSLAMRASTLFGVSSESCDSSPALHASGRPASSRSTVYA